MKNMFNPKSVAVVGASDKKGKIGNILVKNLKNKKYKGKIFPINPRHKIIEGLKAAPSILEIKGKIDLVIIAIPAPYVLLAVEECVEKSVKNVVIISAGFSESGEEGKKREEEIKKVAEENGINILGPNCLGFINTAENINASFAKKEITSGKIGLISQSGAFVTGLLDLAKEETLGFSKIITMGNKTILDEVDFLEYLAKDSKTKIIGLYLENIKKGRRFYNAVSKISKEKPILVLKAGNSEKVQKAILSHTGSMAGESSVTQKAFQESGALYFEEIEKFWQSLKLFNNHKKPQSNQLAILTNAGGPGVLTTDLVEGSKELELFEFSKKEKGNIKKNLPLAASVENPIDVLGDADSARYEDCLNSLAKIKKVGAVVLLITPQAQTDVKSILKVAQESEDKMTCPVIPVLIGEKEKDTFQFPGEVVSGLEKVFEYQKNQSQKSKVKKEQPKFNVLSSAKIKGIVDQARDEERNIFFYEESLELMRYYNIKALKAENVVGSTKFPKKASGIIMKVDDPAILHKVAHGGIVAGIKNGKELKTAVTKMRKTFKKEKIIIQKQVEKGSEMIIGIKKDLNFGPVLMCGIGGILTEIFDEKLLWILPVTKHEIERDIKNSKIGKIFKKENLDIEELVEEVSKVGKIGWQNNWLKELDINPMFFYPDKKPLAVDVKVKVENE